MMNPLEEAERLIALDEQRLAYEARLAEMAPGSAGAWFKMRDEMPAMMACIRNLYAHIAERYGIDTN